MCPIQCCHEPTLGNQSEHAIEIEFHHAGTPINQAPNELQQCTCHNSTRYRQGPPWSCHASHPMDYSTTNPNSTPICTTLSSTTHSNWTNTYNVPKPHPTMVQPPPGFHGHNTTQGSCGLGITQGGQGCGYGNRTCNNNYGRYSGTPSFWM